MAFIYLKDITTGVVRKLDSSLSKNKIKIKVLKNTRIIERDEDNKLVEKGNKWVEVKSTDFTKQKKSNKTVVEKETVAEVETK